MGEHNCDVYRGSASSALALLAVHSGWLAGWLGWAGLATWE